MSELFAWTEEYSVDVVEMDEQHKQFIALGNDVLEYAATCAQVAVRPEQLQFLLDRLGNYALYHLGSEEVYLKKFGCAHVDRHLYMHKQFRDTLRSYMSRYRDGVADPCRLANEIASFCVSWLLTHILVMDKGYTTCFHRHGKS